MSICYGVFLVPKTAWYPLSGRMFKGLGVLVYLGLSGVGKHSFQPTKCVTHLSPYKQVKRLQNGGLGNYWLLWRLSENSHQHLPFTYTNKFFHQTWPDSTPSSIYTSRFVIYDLPSSIRFGSSNICSVGFFLLMCDSLAVTFLWPELEIFSERRMLDAQVWHLIRPSWWPSRSVVSGGTLDPF